MFADALDWVSQAMALFRNTYVYGANSTSMGEKAADFFCLMIVKFLMDAKLAIPIPKKVSHQLGAAIGVGTEVRSSNLMSFFFCWFWNRKEKKTSSQLSRLLLWEYLEVWVSSFQILRHCRKLKTSGLSSSEEREVWGSMLFRSVIYWRNVQAYITYLTLKLFSSPSFPATRS